MNSVLLLAALSLLAVGGGLVVASILGARDGRRTLERRIDLVSSTPASDHAVGAGARKDPGKLEAFIRRLFTLGIRAKWGMRTGGFPLLLWGVAGAGAAWLLTGQLLRLPIWVANVSAIVGFLLLPRFMASTEQGRAELKFLEGFPDAIDMVIRMLRAGLPVTAAIRTVGTEASAPVGAVFTDLANQVDIGIPVGDALLAAAKRVQLPDFRFFAVAVAMQHATGGNLAVTLEILSDIIRKRRALRLKASAVTAEVRMTAYILAAIPAFLVAALLAFFPNYLTPLVEDPRGKFIIGGAIAMLATGFLIMRQMMHSVLRF